MNRRAYLMLGAVLSTVLIVFVATISYFVLPRTVTITRTEQGFVPQNVIIKKGDTIRFITKTTTPFWPASDSHPSHGLYSAFDPKQAIQPDASWSFTFERYGSWGYHDHLAPGIHGTIEVTGGQGLSVDDCLKRKADGALAPECWEPSLTSILKKKGLDAAFDYVDSEYASDPRFRRNCHDVMHILGTAAYQEFTTNHGAIARPDTAYCGFGFYHGFIEAMLVANGPDQFVEVHAYCELSRAGTPTTWGFCIHGIGHALFDSLDGSLWGNASRMTMKGIELCEKAVPEADSRPQCTSGVYNSLANAMSARSYNLSYDTFNPVAFCEAQPEHYKEACYSELVIGYIRNERMTPVEAITYVLHIPKSQVPHGIFVYFADEVKRNMATFSQEEFYKRCSALPSSLLTHECVRGVVEGIREESQPDKTYVLAFPFCSLLPSDTEREFCVHFASVNMRTDSIARPAYQQACSAVLHTGSGSICKQ